jgi:hypothetical protein
MNSATTLICPDGSSSLSEEFPIVILGHYPEGDGEHYMYEALGYDWSILQTIIDNATQITWENPEKSMNMNINTDDMDQLINSEGRSVY